MDEREPRKTVHYGPIGFCRVHPMSRGCEGRLDDCLVEKIARNPPKVGFFRGDERTTDG
jgi:hypothetical protein